MKKVGRKKSAISSALSFLTSHLGIIVFVSYFVISSLIFFRFFQTAPVLVWDSGQYADLADQIIARKMDFLHFNFNKRTYAQPVYLALQMLIADVFHLPHPQFIYVVNLGLFLVTNLLIYWRIKDFSLPIARLFLFLSSFNVITLSFANTYLTENTAIFLTAVLFFLLARSKFENRTAFFAGLTAGLFVFVRPSTLILFVFIFLYICFKQIKLKKGMLSVCFVLGAALPFILGMTNTYFVDGKIGIFTGKTQGIYDMQVHQGPIWIKYETNIDTRYKYPTIYYINGKNQLFYSVNCETAAQCFIGYVTREPLQYGISLATHIFNMFDRVYLDTYIRDLPGRLPLLQFGNYIVLSGALLGVFFFKFPPQWKTSLESIFILTAGLVAIYIPTVIEPRFSAPIYPYVLLLFCFFIITLFKVKKREHWIRFLLFQICLIMMFFVVSDLVNLTMYNGINQMYKRAL